MAEKLIIKISTCSDQIDWAIVDEAGQLRELHQQTGLDSIEHKAQGRKIYALLSDGFVLSEVEFTSKNRSHLAAALPFLMEERIIEDVDQLHIVAGPRDEQDKIPVALIANQSIDHCLARCAEQGLKLDYLIPLPYLLPWESGYWSLQIDQQSAHLKLAALKGCLLDKSSASFMLERLFEEAQHKPQRLICFGQNSAEVADFIDILPSALSDIAETHSQHSLMENIAPILQKDSFINLLQGSYGKSTEWAKLWQKWRSVLGVLACGFLLETGIAYADYKQLNTKQKHLRQEIIKTYQQAFPRQKRVRDPIRRMRSHLKTLQSPSSGPNFLVLLADMSSVMIQSPSLKANNINFDANTGEIRLDLLTDSFETVEQFKSNAANGGLEAILVNSSAKGDEVNARFRIKGKAL